MFTIAGAMWVFLFVFVTWATAVAVYLYLYKCYKACTGPDDFLFYNKTYHYIHRRRMGLVLSTGLKCFVCFDKDSTILSLIGKYGLSVIMATGVLLILIGYPIDKVLCLFVIHMYTI